MDIVVWLQSLGLGKYETVFRENEIDATSPEVLQALGSQVGEDRLVSSARSLGSTAKMPVLATITTRPTKMWTARELFTEKIPGDSA
jgi:hypothetical protein